MAMRYDDKDARAARAAHEARLASEQDRAGMAFSSAIAQAIDDLVRQRSRQGLPPAPKTIEARMQIADAIRAGVAAGMAAANDLAQEKVAAADLAAARAAGREARLRMVAQVLSAANRKLTQALQSRPPRPEG